MRTIFFVLLCSAATACSGDSGTAPTISNLTYAPATATVGMQVTITGTLAFIDEDGDLDKLAAEVVLPDQSRMELAKTSISALGDMKEGSFGFQLIVVPPQAGAYKFQIWVVDDGDNDSNRLDGTLTVN